MSTNGRPDWDGGARLRELRLVGFKSFAEATRLEFGPGISAIVGPNGSGKSNLADALRWALGEQGRSLRTRKSEDVIFAGSARRHATGMADVSLVIGNDDRLLPVEYGLVECGRRLYRSGENEYLLNRQKVRLRDIVDLLDAANLADNAFLFIGQGMVDQALSLRPEERRPLFEEAAGVRRHERRRRQAEERLVEAEANLARVRDILGELRPQARRLAAQAEQQVARRDAGSELAEALVVAGRARWLAASRASQEADARLSSVRAGIDEAMRDLAAGEDAAATVARDMDDRAAAAQTARDVLDEARSTVIEARLTIERLTEVRAGIERDTLRATEERAALDARMAAARRQLALPVPTPDRTAQAALAELDALLAAAVAELAGLEAAARADDERAASLRRARQAREAELADRRRHADDAGQRLAETIVTADAAAARAAIDADALTAAQATLDAAREAEADAERETTEAAVAAERLEARSLASAGRAGSTAERVDRLRARLAAIDAILDAGDRSGLVAAARRRGGRRLAEGLDVEPRLRPAVEAALGALIRAAVAGPELALELRDEQGFVVLDSTASGLAGQAGASKLLAAVAEAGGGPLTEAIRRDPGGQVERLLATVAWVPDLAVAIALQDRLPAGWRLVTERGEVVTANGVVQLGSPDATLERRAERDRLAADLTAAEGEDAGANAEATDVGPRATAARESHSAARTRFDALRAERRRLEEVAAAAARAAEATGREAAWDRAQAERQSAQADRARAALADLVAQEHVAAPMDGDEPTGTAIHAAGQGPDDAADAWQARIGELRARRDAAADAWESADAERRQVEDARRRAEVALSLDDARGRALERDAATRAAAAQRTDDELAAVLTRRAVADDAEAAARATLAALEAQAGDQRRRLVSLEADVVRHRDRLRRADEQARAAEVAELEGRLALDAARESLLVELAALGPVGLAALTTIDGAQAPPAVTDDEALAASLETALDVAVTAWAIETPASDGEAPGPARLASLRRRYHELGASNPFAAEEYDEVRVRLAEMEAQQDDLTAAIDATRALIAELGERITEQFLTTFRALEGAFGRRFEQLFGGGAASLVLTDPEAPTQTGVEIMARPPGKKRQPLAMLSGGERALTAVALLFAMLEVRPVPFCVLDEVDAALDEANVVRFSTALRELATDIQFVVITHNRGTIEAADALYGVTIGDDAVSRVISLRLAEATELAAAAG